MHWHAFKLKVCTLGLELSSTHVVHLRRYGPGTVEVAELSARLELCQVNLEGVDVEANAAHASQPISTNAHA